MLFIARFLTKKTIGIAVILLIVLALYIAHRSQLADAHELLVKAKAETIEIVKAEKVYAEKQIKEIEDEVYYTDVTSSIDTF